MPVRPVSPRAPYLAPLAVGLLGALVRLIYVYQGSRDPSFYHPIIDASQYHEFAKIIARGVDPWNGVFTRPPLYIYFLAGIYALFGPHMIAARVIQALLGGATCVITFLLGRQLFDRRVGLLAALVVALYGPLVFFDERLQATSLEVFCFTLALWTAVRAAHCSTWYNWLICGMAIGVAALARPTIAVFLPAVVTWIAVSAIRGPRRAASMGRLCALICGCAAAVSPVTIRNYAASGEFVPISSLGGLNLYIGNNPDAVRTIAIRTGPEWKRLCRLPHREGMVARSAADRYYLRQVASFARSQPAEFLAGLARKARLFCSSIEVPRNYDLYLHRRFSPLLRALAWRVGTFGFPFGVLAPLAVLGMVLAGRARPERWLVVGYVLACAVSVILFFNAGRYRVPIVPALALFAVWAVVWLREQFRAARYRRLAAGVAVVLGTGVVISLPVATPYDGINFEADLYTCLGGRLIEEGDYDGAEQALANALAMTPDSAVLHDALSYVARRRGRFRDALDHARAAVRLDPNFVDARITLGSLLGEAGALEESAAQLQRAVDAEPSHPRAHAELATTLARQRDYAAAAEHYRQAIRLETDYPPHHMGLAGALIVERRYREAIEALEQAARQAPSVTVRDGLAWILATCPDAALRDCGRAIALAERAVAGVVDPHPIYLDTLAAAYACAGRFEDAVRAADRAVAIARAAGFQRLGAVIDHRARLYRQRQPCHDPIRSPDALTAW